MPRPIRVFHCDDSTAFTRLVRHWLDEHGDLKHVGAAHSAEAALAALAAEARPDIVLLDTLGSPGDGTLLEEIREAAPDARVIVYSGYVSIIGAEELGGGADAFLAKADDEATLVSTIRSVAGR